MKGACPACGASGSVEVFVTDAEARECVLLASRLPASLGPLAIKYLGLFRPAQRALAWGRAQRLLADLVAMIEAREVKRDGRRIPAGHDAFDRAMTQMLDQRERLSLPLKNHAYLVTIIAGEAPRVAAAAEDAAETGKRQAANAKAATRKLAEADLAGEIAARVRLKLPAMTDDEEKAYLRKRMGEARD